MSRNTIWTALGLILACTFACAITFGGDWLKHQAVGIWANQVADVAQFGWEDDTPENLIAELPELEYVDNIEAFDVKAEFDEYMLEKYGPDQEIYFACSYWNSQDNFEKMKVSRAVLINCYYGSAFIYHNQLP